MVLGRSRPYKKDCNVKFATKLKLCHVASRTFEKPQLHKLNTSGQIDSMAALTAKYIFGKI